MRASGMFTIDQMRTINETRMHAVWKLGRLPAKVERGTSPGRGKKIARPETTISVHIFCRLDRPKRRPK
jgi:hypothetical protein